MREGENRKAMRDGRSISYTVERRSLEENQRTWFLMESLPSRKKAEQTLRWHLALDSSHGQYRIRKLERTVVRLCRIKEEKMKDDRGFDPVDLDNYITGHYGEDQGQEDQGQCITVLGNHSDVCCLRQYYNTSIELQEDLEFLSSLDSEEEEE